MFAFIFIIIISILLTTLFKYFENQLKNNK